MKLLQITEARWVEITGGYNPAKGQRRPERHHDTAPGTWWHGTSTSRLDRILENGLMSPSGTHVTMSRSLARFSALRAASRFGGKPIVLKLSLDNIDDTLTGTAENSVFLKPVPSEAIMIDRGFKFAKDTLYNFKKMRSDQGYTDR